MTSDNRLQITLTILFFVFSLTLNCDNPRHETFSPYGNFFSHLTEVADVNYHTQTPFSPLAGSLALLLTSPENGVPFLSESSRDSPD